MRLSRVYNIYILVSRSCAREMISRYFSCVYTSAGPLAVPSRLWILPWLRGIGRPDAGFRNRSRRFVFARFGLYLLRVCFGIVAILTFMRARLFLLYDGSFCAPAVYYVRRLVLNADRNVYEPYFR